MPKKYHNVTYFPLYTVESLPEVGNNCVVCKIKLRTEGIVKKYLTENETWKRNISKAERFDVVIAYKIADNYTNSRKQL